MKSIVKIVLICSLLVLVLNSSYAQSDVKPMTDTQRNTFIKVLQRINQKYESLNNSSAIESAPFTAVENNQTFPAKGLPIITADSRSALKNNIVIVNESQDDLKSGIPEGENLILSLYVNKLYVAEVFGYKSSKGAKINASDLFEVLDFPIDIDFDNKIMKGWFIRENNKFEFNFNSFIDGNNVPSVSINGISGPMDTADFLIEDNSVYVEGNLLSQWFGLGLTYKFNDLQIKLIPKEALPIETRLARQSKKINTTQKSLPTRPWKESPYQMISSPLVDLQIQHLNNSRVNSSFSSYSALGSHDLAFMNTEYYVAGRSDKELSDARIKFSKELKPGIFGFLPSANISFGDINSVNINSARTGGLNRGVSFSKTLSEVNDNQRININGDIQPGWDVELFQNNILVANQTSVETGRYEFDNIDLLYGNNNFEIISYGPQGQVERDYREVFIDSNALSSLEQDYGFSITEVGKSLLSVNDELITENKGLLFAGSYSLGLTDWLSVSLGQSSFFSDELENEFNYSFGTNLTLFENILLHADFSINQNNIVRSYFTGRTQWLGQSLFYSLNLQDNTLLLDGLHKKVTENQHLLRMGGQLLDFNSYRLNYNNQILYRDDINGIETTQFVNQLSLSAGRFAIQNSLGWKKIQDSMNSNESVDGFMQIQQQLGRVFSRFLVGYSIKPETEINSFKTEFSWSMFEKLQSNLKFNYIPSAEQYRADLGLTWRFDTFTITNNFSYNNDDEWSIGLFLRFGIGYDVSRNNAFMSSTSLTNTGVMSVRVFEDDNNDGIFNEGETPIEGAKVRAIQAQRQAISGSDGIAVIKNLPVNVTTDIEIDSSTLSDPFYILSSKGVSITPRKAFLGRTEYPVVTSSEIDGTIYAVDLDSQERSLAYVPIVLLDEGGEVVATTQSEFDGYYLFVDLIPGRYFVSIASDYLKKHNLEHIDDLSVNLSVQGDVINGSDFVIKDLEFTKGYVVKVGEFVNLPMLKVYWHLIQKRYRAKLKQTAFYVEKESTRRYSLNLAFYPDKSEAYQACQQIAEADIQCDVEAFEFVSQ
jgi:hypothetical protein